MMKNKVEEQAKRCVILAIKCQTVINFEEVLDLDSIKNLKEVTFYNQFSNRNSKKCLTS
jgi:hypothetical protein